MPPGTRRCDHPNRLSFARTYRRRDLRRRPANQAETARSLDRAGWGVVTVSPGEDLAGAWERLAARNPVGMLR